MRGGLEVWVRVFVPTERVATSDCPNRPPPTLLLGVPQANNAYQHTHIGDGGCFDLGGALQPALDLEAVMADLQVCVCMCVCVCVCACVRVGGGIWVGEGEMGRGAREGGSEGGRVAWVGEAWHFQALL